MVALEKPVESGRKWKARAKRGIRDGQPGISIVNEINETRSLRSARFILALDINDAPHFRFWRVRLSILPPFSLPLSLSLSLSSPPYLSLLLSAFFFNSHASH